MLERYALRRASSVLLNLAKRMPSTIHRQIDNGIEDISLDHVQIGDYIIVYPHETCPVDGIVVEGYGYMDESYLTGEPYIIPKTPGAIVLSGAINGDSVLHVRAEKHPQDSRYAQIMKVMRESEQSRPQLRRLGDQLGALFAPLSLIIAALVWYVSQDMVRFLAVLVIATPCPLLIAIPITIISAISLAARQGIIINDPLVLERLPTCKVAIFDKTGTLTYGQAELQDITIFPGFSKDFVLQHVAALERFSKHPLALAIVKAAQEKSLILPRALHVAEKPGEGLKGYVAGHLIQITNRKNISSDQLQKLPLQQTGMESIILIDNKIAAVFHFRDTLRVEGYSFIRHLAPMHQFKKIIIISGDQASEVKDIAKKLGVKHIYANQTPEQKVDLVRAETRKSPTLFMGDGINDAPALAVATVGLAFGAHNVITSEAAGAVFLEKSLLKVDELIHMSTLMRRVALMSAGGGIFLSLIGMYFAAIGMISPVYGALLQEGIDILAILNALRLTWRTKAMADMAFPVITKKDKNDSRRNSIFSSLS
jgi:heavy metal translocating P-type ATPase